MSANVWGALAFITISHCPIQSIQIGLLDGAHVSCEFLWFICFCVEDTAALYFQFVGGLSTIIWLLSRAIPKNCICASTDQKSLRGGLRAIVPSVCVGLAANGLPDIEGCFLIHDVFVYLSVFTQTSGELSHHRTKPRTSTKTHFTSLYWSIYRSINRSICRWPELRLVTNQIITFSTFERIVHRDQFIWFNTNSV